MEYKLADNVFLLGFVDNSYAVLDKMDVFVFPSLWEGVGNALVEAMACGLPCIATDYESGAREILKDNSDKKIDKDCYFADYGVIVPNMSAEQLTSKDALDSSEMILKEAMQKMIDNEELRKYYSLKALERADFFSQDKCGMEWAKII